MAGAQALSPIPDRTLVIIHVEDTLKLSHALNFWDSLNYSRDSKRRFIGMNAALSLLERKNPRMSFVYLTQGAALLAGKTEQEFVKNNSFPKGLFADYSSLSIKEDRLLVLEKLIRSANPTRVILMSHNGGPDLDIFHELVAKFRHVTFMPYAHMVYSSSSSEFGSFPYSEQTGYVTAVELLVDWQQKGLLDYSEALKLSQALIPRIVAETAETVGVLEYAVPNFMNCDNFQWRWAVDKDYSFLAPLHEYLINRCHAQAPLAGYQESF